MKTKNIKVQYSSRYQSGFAPKIQMEGRWLEKHGFPIGIRKSFWQAFGSPLV